MSARTAQRERLIAKRAGALAVMFLTGRSDLVVEERSADQAPGFLVRFMAAHQEGIRQFGVEVQGDLSAATMEHADRILLRSLRHAQADGPFTFPVCLFLFAMQENKAWYTWAVEPLVQTGKAMLRMHKSANCKPLDRRALDDIVTQVGRWYDAFSANLVTNGVPRHGRN
jgi:hypothetical protein